VLAPPRANTALGTGGRCGVERAEQRVVVGVLLDTAVRAAGGSKSNGTSARPT
jgi:hypothetical protein